MSKRYNETERRAHIPKSTCYTSKKAKTCGTNYELEDNAECTYSGTRKLACNTCSMILTTNNNKQVEIVQTVHM